MKTTKRSVFQFIAMMLFGSALIVGCNNNDPAANGTVILKMDAASATGTTINGRSTNGRTQATTVITDFKVSIREIEFEFDEEDSHFKTDSAYDDIKLKGTSSRLARLLSSSHLNMFGGALSGSG